MFLTHILVIGNSCYCSVHKENSILMQWVCAVSCCWWRFRNEGGGGEIVLVLPLLYLSSRYSNVELLWGRAAHSSLIPAHGLYCIHTDGCNHCSWGHHRTSHVAMASALRMCSPVEMRRCLASRWKPGVPTNTPVNGVVSELRVEQGLSSSNSGYLDGFSLELTMRVLSLYKRKTMQELREAEEGEEPDADALASIIRDQHFDSEEECSDHSVV